MEKTAIVTGASSGIGQAISEVLLNKGYKVFGIGRNFSKHLPGLDEIQLDLLDTEKLIDTITRLKKENDIYILVNAAGAAYYGLFEEINTKQIQEMVRVNLEAPMLITQMLLRDLKKNNGYIVNISSVTATSSNPHGVAYGATKAGLSSFSASLFDEARKYGIKVCDIKPDMTQTNLYRNANFKADEDLSASLLPEDVADAISYLLDLRDGMLISNMVLKPQLHRIKKKEE